MSQSRLSSPLLVRSCPSRRFHTESHRSDTDWDFNWANVEWIREFFDRIKMVRGAGHSSHPAWPNGPLPPRPVASCTPVVSRSPPPGSAGRRAAREPLPQPLRADEEGPARQERQAHAETGEARRAEPRAGLQSAVARRWGAPGLAPERGQPLPQHAQPQPRPRPFHPPPVFPPSQLERVEDHEEAAAYDFVPESFVLPGDYALFVEAFRRSPGNTWIMKPVGRAQGRGIFLIKKLSQIAEWRKDHTWKGDAPRAESYIVQRYVDRPYTVGSKKFDCRLYAMVTSFTPLTVWFHREGFARFSSARYDHDAGTEDLREAAGAAGAACPALLCPRSTPLPPSRPHPPLTPRLRHAPD